MSAHPLGQRMDRPRKGERVHDREWVVNQRVTNRQCIPPTTRFPFQRGTPGMDARSVRISIFAPSTASTASTASSSHRARTSTEWVSIILPYLFSVQSSSRSRRAGANSSSNSGDFHPPPVSWMFVRSFLRARFRPALDLKDTLRTQCGDAHTNPMG